MISVRAQTDRAAWSGRNREPSQPLAHIGGQEIDGVRSTGLDPIASLSMQMRVPAYGSVHVTIGTAAATTRDTLEALVDRYQQPLVIDRAALMSTTLSAIRMREMRISSDEMRAIQTITTMLVLLVSRPHAEVRETAFDRRSLWRFGISGDRPIIVVEAAAVRGIGLVRSLVRALRLWSWGGVACDLIVLDSEPSSYQMPLQRELSAIREQFVRDIPSGPCELHLVATATVTPTGANGTDGAAALAAVRRRPFAVRTRAGPSRVARRRARRDGSISRSARPSVPDRAAAATTARGQFDGSGRFRFPVNATSRPARPWINVLANPNFGAQISEAGSGYTWADNSRMHQLTPWSNDPVADPSGESYWLQDVRTRETWNVAAAADAADATYTVEHGQGQTTIRHRQGDLDVSATWCVDAAQSIKHVRITLRNIGTRARRMRIVGAIDWVMGAQRADRQSVCTSAEARHGRCANAAVRHAMRRQRRLRRQHRVLRERRRRTRRRHAGRLDLRSSRAVRLRRQTGDSARVRQARRHATRSVRRHCAGVRNRAGPDARMHVRARPRQLARRGARVGAHCARRCRSARAQLPRALGRTARHRHGRHARSAVRRAGESLVAVPDARVPAVGARGFLSGRRRVRIPRSVAGLDGARDRRAATVAQAAAAVCVPTVRRRGRAALVASAGRRRRAHAIQRRPAVVAVRDRALRRRHRRRRRSSTRPPRFSKANRFRTTPKTRTSYRASANSAHRCTNTARARSTAASRSARTVCR